MILAHLKVEPAEISQSVLLPGDPARVDVIGRKLKNFLILRQNREFRIGSGTYNGVPITVCSTGIGSPSTAIATEELIRAGARTLIRVGTCGAAWRDDIKAGSLVVPSASVRDEGTTDEYVPKGFPAVADPAVTRALERAARATGRPTFIGVNRTHDAFYAPPASAEKWKDAPILSSDMETSALFVVATLRGARAGAVLAVNADPGRELIITESSSQITEATVDAAANAALEALHHLNQPS